MSKKEATFKPIFNNFWLKLIAIFTMTCDHVGYYITMYSPVGWLKVLSIILRLLGRISLPLFCFMVAEAIKYTKSFPKYILRLGIMFSIMLVTYLITIKIPYFANHGIVLPQTGIIFIDLILGALGCFALKQENKVIKALAVLPILYGVLCFAISCYEISTPAIVYWLPYYLRTQSGWYGVTLIIGFFLCKNLTTSYLKGQEKLTGMEANLMEGTDYAMIVYNVLAILVLVVLTFISFFLTFVLPNVLGIDHQVAMILAGIFIFFYNHKVGYKKKWFTTFTYLYYPVHFILIFLVFELLLVL